ncbi:MAG TPA: trigger factor [Pyrinomonadaceae bacterium]|nr:trigger factor [Pyrinomonadaceae bacterium]
MKTELLEVSPTQKEITIEIEPEEVREVYNKVSKKYAKGAQVDGFRKGFAPLDIIRLRYKEEIKSEVLQELFSPKVGEAIQEFNLNPLSEPHLHIENSENLKVNGSQPISLRVHVEVMPEIPAPEYKNLEVTRRVRPLSDDELSLIIDERRQESATLIPVEDRKSRDGDTVIIDLEGTFADDETGEPIKAEDLEIKLGDANIEKSFTENLEGVEEDEEKEFTVAYAADFTSPLLAGKTVNYKAKIKSVGKVELPELDDEWAQSLDENFESLEDLRSKLREDLKIVANEEADNRLRSELIAKLIEAHDFEVPSALIDLQARNLLNNFAQAMAGRGVDLNKVDKDFVQMAYTQMQGQAERDVRGAILLEKVAELENVEISDEEVNEELERMAQYYRTTMEEIRHSLSQQQDGEANIANSLRTRKAVQALVDHAKITDGEWIDENQPTAEAEDKDAEEQKKEKKPKAEKKKAEVKEPKKKAAKKE